MKSRKGSNKRTKHSSPTHYRPVNNSGSDMTTDTTLSNARMSVPVTVLEGQIANGIVPAQDCAETGFNNCEEIGSATTVETEVDNNE